MQELWEKKLALSAELLAKEEEKRNLILKSRPSARHSKKASNKK